MNHIDRDAHPPAALHTSTRLIPGRLSDRLAALLAEQIETGRLARGERLPTEPELVRLYGVSRTVVREAVSQLKSRDLLVSRQGSGVFVSTAPARQPLIFDPAVMGSMAAVVQVVEVRRAIEGEIAALAALRARRPDIDTIRRALLAIDASVQAGGDGVMEDLAFHRSIAEVTGNAQFTQVLGFLEQYLHDAVRVTRANEKRHAAFAAQVHDEHWAIFEAIDAGDAVAARAAATEHMVQAAQRLIQGGVVPDFIGAAQPSPGSQGAAKKGGHR
ncbi:MAG: FadR family transcriptional regulator [Comamonadaceae bacterium]|nr:MAG: FadR family transcriptional regulator [Comamonadaceae bacterium]